MRWYLLKPLARLVSWAIIALGFLISLMGCFRFFLVTGASPRYLLQRKRWFEETMLGRKMRLSDVLEFGAWHAAGR
jgi:hypothetical protein